MQAPTDEVGGMKMVEWLMMTSHVLTLSSSVQNIITNRAKQNLSSLRNQKSISAKIK